MAQTNLNSSSSKNKSFQASQGSTLSHLTDEIGSRYNDLRERIEDMTDSSAKLVKAHPLYAILGAAAAGIVVGMFVQGRRK
jgi:ElaB/YqjD/DUF883 family membrane-anchored ribosome-binding protein